MALEFAAEPHPNPTPAAGIAEVLADPGFGRHFTDHMAQARWTVEDGWHDDRLVPFGPLSISPATAVLHYGQEIFEGLKAYRHADGSIWTFRPEVNAERFARSAQRMALPELPVADFLRSLEAVVRADSAWVPDADEQSLYLRPFTYASQPFLGVRPSAEATYLVIASPVGGYFSAGVRPVSIWLSDTYTRAAPGGTGAAKCGGNYAAGMAPMAEAAAHGCDQVCFLDAVERRYVEELGGMNLYFVTADDRLVTPDLGTILEGVTRESILVLGRELGLTVEERPVDVAEWQQGLPAGQIREVFACGTGAAVTPVGRLVWSGGEAVSPVAGERDSVAMTLRRSLLDIQYGRAEDPHGWMRRLV